MSSLASLALAAIASPEVFNALVRVHAARILKPSGSPIFKASYFATYSGASESLRLRCLTHSVSNSSV